MSDEIRDLDEELDEMIEELTGYSIEELRELREEEERSSIRVLDPNKVKAIDLCAAAIKKAIAQTDCRNLKIKSGKNEFNPMAGYVSVEGRDIGMTELGWFAFAAQFAENMEVYALANGGVRLAFTFYDLTVRL